MKSFTDAILSAEHLNKRAEKHAMLGGLDVDAQRLIAEAYNPFRVYNVRKFAQPAHHAHHDAPFSHFFDLLDSLHDRKIVGNDARAAVTNTLAMYTPRTASVLVRVLNKDLKCGAGRDTFEAIYPDLGIPSFELMLAAKIEEKAVKTKKSDVLLTEEIFVKKYKMSFPCIAESKYDGKRFVAYVYEDSIEYYARGGKSADYAADLFEDQLYAMQKLVGEPIVVDGELLAGSFSQTMKSKGSANDDAKAALKFYVFDYMTMREWIAQRAVDDQITRTRKLTQLIQQVDPTNEKLVKSKWTIVKNIAELVSFYKVVIEEGHNEDGSLNGLGEGLIIKRLNGAYEWDRSKNWFKWKPVIDLDLKITGWEYGNGRLSQTVGKVYLWGFDENGTEIVARCGSGMKDKDRAELLAAFKADGLAASPAGSTLPTAVPFVGQITGRTVMIEAQELTLAQGATVHSARFPIYCKVRADK